MHSISVYEDKEIPKLKIQLEKLEIKLNELYVQRDEYLAIFQSFNEQYSKKLGKYVSEILRISVELARRKLNQNINNPNEETFAEAYREATDAFREFQHDYEEVLEKQEPRKLKKEDTKKLKLAFKKASKICHPDMVADEYKDIATEIFQKLSKAYQNKDLHTVEEILLSLENEGFFKPSSDTLTTSDTLKNKIIAMKDKVLSVNYEIQDIQDNETYKIILSLDGNYEDFFEQKASELKIELSELKDKLKLAQSMDC